MSTHTHRIYSSFTHTLAHTFVQTERRPLGECVASFFFFFLNPETRNERPTPSDLFRSHTGSGRSEEVGGGRRSAGGGTSFPIRRLLSLTFSSSHSRGSLKGFGHTPACAIRATRTVVKWWQQTRLPPRCPRINPVQAPLLLARLPLPRHPSLTRDENPSFLVFSSPSSPLFFPSPPPDANARRLVHSTRRLFSTSCAT